MRSTPISRNDEIKAEQLNALLADTVNATNAHEHSGELDDGIQIQFSKIDPSSALAPSGLTKTLQQIDAHIGAIAGNGNIGVHGLSDSVSPVGIFDSTTPTGWTIRQGYYEFPSPIGWEQDNNYNITFTPAFPNELKAIIISVHETVIWGADFNGVCETPGTRTGFTANISAQGNQIYRGEISGFFWFAIGR